MKKIEIGDRIPEFSLIDDKGNRVHIAPPFDGPLVLYFYPKDDTTGCTKQACAYRDSYAAFLEEKVRVIGISGDAQESHSAFVAKYELPFTLLSDTENAVRKQFGISNNLLFIPGRVTYVIDRDGIVRFLFNSQWKTEQHVTEALAHVKALKP